MLNALEQAARRPVSRETFAGLEAYVAHLRAASLEQNLLAASTLDTMWERHILDSAQLLRFEPRPSASWVDIGSGAGLPGLVIALLSEGPVTLVEPRRLRAAFLQDMVAELSLGSRVTILQARAERVSGPFDVITARAVAPLTRLLGMTLHLAHNGTVWALPKGRSAKSELAEAKRSWQCAVRSEMSCTDPESTVLVLSGVRARSKP